MYRRRLTILLILILALVPAFGQTSEHSVFHYARLTAHATPGGKIVVPALSYYAATGQLKVPATPKTADWVMDQTYDFTCEKTGVTSSSNYTDEPRLFLFAKPNTGYRYVGIVNMQGEPLTWIKHATKANLYYYDWTLMVSGYNPATMPNFPRELEVKVIFAAIDGAGNYLNYQVQHPASVGGSYSVSSSSFSGQITSTSTTVSTTYTSNSPVRLSAVADAGYEFVGWCVRRNADPSAEVFVSYSATTTFYCDADEQLYPVFHSISDPTPLFAAADQLFTDLNDACTYALASSSDRVILVGSGTLPSSAVVPDGVTLIIPHDGTLDGYMYWVDYGHDLRYSGPYRTLHLGSATTLTIEGRMSVSARQTSLSHIGCGPSSTVYDQYGLVTLDTDAHLVVNAGAQLYCYGYISGDGDVEVMSGAEVYETFQIMDWRGSDYLYHSVQRELNRYEQYLNQYGDTANFDMVFPLNQYYIQNIETTIRYHHGSTERVSATLYASADIHFNPFALIGVNEGLFRLREGAELVRRYDCATGRVSYELQGDASIENLYLGGDLISMVFKILTNLPIYGVQSELYTLPLAHNMDIVVHDGSTADVMYNLCLLPGAAIHVEQNATLHVGSNSSIYVYDTQDWNGHNYAGNGDYIPLQYTHCSGLYSDLLTPPAAPTAATMAIDGTLSLDGYVYTTMGGANICSPSGTGMIVQSGKCGTATEARHSSGVDGDHFSSMAITPARWRNADDSYTESVCEPGTTYEYNDSLGRWLVNGELPPGPDCEKTIHAAVSAATPHGSVQIQFVNE